MSMGHRRRARTGLPTQAHEEVFANWQRDAVGAKCWKCDGPGRVGMKVFPGGGYTSTWDCADPACPSHERRRGHWLKETLRSREFWIRQVWITALVAGAMLLAAAFVHAEPCPPPFVASGHRSYSEECREQAIAERRARGFWVPILVGVAAGLVIAAFVPRLAKWVGDALEIPEERPEVGSVKEGYLPREMRR